MPLLQLQQVHKAFGGLRAVHGVSFDLPAQSIVGLIGPNGSGKTTLFNLITGVYRADDGAIYFRDERIDGLDPAEIYRLGLVRSFQIPRLFFRLTVLDNMILAGRGQYGDGFIPAVFRRRRWRPQEEDLRARALEYLEFLELTRLKDALPSSLSGGQMKLLELGRALMAEPTLLLLDEPAAGVNPLLAERIFEKIAQLREERALSFLIIEHRIELILHHVDQLHVMHKGELIMTGPPSDVAENQQVVSVYLGEA